MRTLDGVSEADARVTPTASSLSLLSLVKHAATWERRWFQIVYAGRSLPDPWPGTRDPQDGTFHLDDEDTIVSVVDDYWAQVAVSRQILADGDLDSPCARQDLADYTLRGVALHLIQETARHAGHADIIRETIDGVRGT